MAELTDTERLLVEEVLAGRPFVGRSATESAHPVRGTVLADLLDGHFGEVTPSGVAIAELTVVGTLSLRDREIKSPLLLNGVRLPDLLDLSQSTIRRLSLQECEIGGIRADGLRTTDLDLAGTRVANTVQLQGSTVQGNIRLDGTTILGKDERGYALDVSNARISGNVVAVKGPLHCPKGALRLSHLRLSGILEFVGDETSCIGGRNKRGFAVEAVSPWVDGSIAFNSVRFSGGGVRLLQATIGGALIMRGSSLGTSTDHVCLHGEGMEIGGNVLLDHWFHSDGGAIMITRASVGGDLVSDSALLSVADESAAALVLDGTSVAGEVSLSFGADRPWTGQPEEQNFRDFVAQGSVRLVAADIGDRLNCTSGKFLAGAGRDALIADRIRVGAEVLLDAGFEAEGEVRFAAASIGRTMSFENGSFTNPGETAFHGNGMTVGGRWDMRPRTMDGLVSAQGVSVVTLTDRVHAWPDGWRGDGFRFEDFDSQSATDPTLRIDWLQKQGGDFWSPHYTSLADVYRRRGDLARARSVLIASEQRRTDGLSGVSQLAYRSWGVVSCFGHQPQRAIWALVALLVASSSMFAFAEMEPLGQPS